jgi:HEAT repeat protein
MDRFDELIDQLTSDSIATRRNAVEGLGELGDKRAVEPIIGLLNDEAEVVHTAVFWLGQLKDERVVEPLIELLKKEDKTPNQQIRGQIGSTLKIFESAIDPLIELLIHQDFGIRINAVRALGRYHNKQTVGPLIDLLKIESKLPSPEYSIFAIFDIIESLEEIYDDLAIEPLIELLKHEDINIPPVAAEALMQFGNERAIEPLTELLTNQDLTYRRQVIVDALESIKLENGKE